MMMTMMMIVKMMMTTTTASLRRVIGSSNHTLEPHLFLESRTSLGGVIGSPKQHSTASLCFGHPEPASGESSVRPTTL
eukprot:4036156-Heterocapsa_arctica.AAC.1